MMEPDSVGSAGAASAVDFTAETTSTTLATDSSEFSFEVEDEPDAQASNFQDDVNGMGNPEPTAFADSFDDFDDFESIPDFDLSDSSAGFTSPSIGAMPSQFGAFSGDGPASVSGGVFWRE